MTMQVLKQRQQVDTARAELERRGVPRLDSPMRTRWLNRARRLGIRCGPSVGDRLKSWDVLETLKFLEANVRKDEAIVDLGAYASEILIALDKSGYTRLTGIDLNPRLNSMPRGAGITYVTADFMATGLATRSFSAITSISVIEHGFDPERLFAEAARLLRPGGFFIASFDYWPDRIDTRGTTFFGMSWTLFARADVEAMLTVARTHGFESVGAIETNGKDRAVHHGGFDYTFAWLALVKRG